MGGYSPAAENTDVNESFVFEFSTDVPKNTKRGDDETVKKSREIPWKGLVKTVVIGWPPGANNAAGVAFGRKGAEDFLPRNPEDQFLAGNHFTHAFDVTAVVAKEEDLEAEFVNYDSSNSHFVNVFVTIERLE